MRGWIRFAAVGLALAGGAGADQLDIDFDGPPGGAYTTTVLNDGSALSAGAANGRYEVTGAVVADTEPKVLLEPTLRLDGTADWSVDVRVAIDATLFAPLNTRDSLQAWINVYHAADDDDEVRAKSGNLKGIFDVGGAMIGDGYFASSGYALDVDNVPGSASPTEYAAIEPAAAGPATTAIFDLSVFYVAATDLLTTRYRVDGGVWVVYPLEDDQGAPAPPLRPVQEWGLSPGDPLDVTLLISATRAATQPGESGAITSSFSLASGDLHLDDLLVTGTFVPEPGALALGLAALLVLAGCDTQRSGRRAGHGRERAIHALNRGLRVRLQPLPGGRRAASHDLPPLPRLSGDDRFRAPILSRPPRA